MLGAAIFSESDYIRSVSSHIMVGSLINGGTGSFDVMLDHEKVMRTMPVKTVEKTSIIKKTNCCGRPYPQKES